MIPCLHTIHCKNHTLRIQEHTFNSLFYLMLKNEKCVAKSAYVIGSGIPLGVHQ